MTIRTALQARRLIGSGFAASLILFIGLHSDAEIKLFGTFRLFSLGNDSQACNSSLLGESPGGTH